MPSLNPSMPSPRSDSVDTTPLLTHSIADHLLRSRHLLRRQPPPLRGAAARLLQRASSRRMMLREPSVRVRENAAEQLEEQQSNWAYSKPIIVLDVLWNLGFIAIAVVVLALSVKEKPEVPLRLWIIGYGLQCLLHIACVIYEYRRRLDGRSMGMEASGVWESGDSSSGSGSDGGDYMDYVGVLGGNDDETSSVKHLESANTMFSFIWWIVGFYWVTAGGQTVTSDSPQLYWLCIIFLAFDVIFVIICIAVACLIGIAICCCLPCIIGILYAMTDRARGLSLGKAAVHVYAVWLLSSTFFFVFMYYINAEGATKEEIDQLPKYKFRRIGECEIVNGETEASLGGTITECESDTLTERLISPEDAECCICLCAYEDGTELRELPCHHHFHSTCIEKWLYINATCPLCKLNILKANNQIYEV